LWKKIPRLDSIKDMYRSPKLHMHVRRALLFGSKSNKTISFQQITLYQMINDALKLFYFGSVTFGIPSSKYSGNSFSSTSIIFYNRKYKFWYNEPHQLESVGFPIFRRCSYNNQIILDSLTPTRTQQALL
jgi:hypothetical protein